VKERRVWFTETAEEHVKREHAWWRDNRDHQQLFQSELDLAIELVAMLPGTGSVYVLAGTPGMRRLYLGESTATSITRSMMTK
jgi:hypothetical protein